MAGDVRKPEGEHLTSKLSTPHSNGHTKSKTYASLLDTSSNERDPNSSLEHSGEDWSGGTSSVSDEEDENYDTMKLDAGAVISPSRGAGVENTDLNIETLANLDGMGMSKTQPEDGRNSFSIRRSSTSDQVNGGPKRRKSIHVVLEKTDRKGRYVLTAEEPEIRDILKHKIEQELDPKKRKSFRDLVFTRQFTTFDRQNPLSSESPFHGFFTLFWLCMVMLLVRVAAHNWRDYGSILGRAEILHLMTDRDLLVLGITDGVMCLGTMFGLGLQKLIAKEYLSWSGSGWIIQNLWQSFYLGAVVWWTYYRDWPWTHTVFIVLHSLVFLMKQHSYAFYNGYRECTRRRILFAELTNSH